MPNPFETNAPGSSGLGVSQFSLGAAPVGNLRNKISEEEALLTIEEALNSSINYVDIFLLWIWPLKNGLPLPAKLSKRPLISTKVGKLIRPYVKALNSRRQTAILPGQSRQALHF